MITTLYIVLAVLGVAALLCLFGGSQSVEQDLQIQVGNGQLWDDEEEEQPVERKPEPAFKWPHLYHADPIIDLAWACGYSQDEINAMLRSSRIYLERNGVRAEFQHYGHYSDRGERLWECFTFEPDADTSDADRWRRQPTEEERRAALGGKR